METTDDTQFAPGVNSPRSIRPYLSNWQAMYTPDPTADKIVTATRECLIRNGMRTTITDVARAAKLSRPTIYRKFSGLEEIIAETLTRELLGLLGTLRSPASNMEFIETIVDTTERVRGNELMQSILKEEPELLVTYQFHRLGRSQLAIVDVLEQILRELPPGADPDATPCPPRRLPGELPPGADPDSARDASGTGDTGDTGDTGRVATTVSNRTVSAASIAPDTSIVSVTPATTVANPAARSASTVPVTSSTSTASAASRPATVGEPVGELDSPARNPTHQALFILMLVQSVAFMANTVSEYFDDANWKEELRKMLKGYLQ